MGHSVEVVVVAYVAGVTDVVAAAVGIVVYVF